MKRNYIIEHIKKFVDDSSRKLAPFIISGKLNVEYIRGNQNKYINGKRLSLENKPLPNNVYAERKFYNRLYPIYLTRFGILANNMPIPGFRPHGVSARRKYDAIRGNDFIQNYLNDIKFKTLYQKIIRHADTYGLAWIKTGIDYSQGGDIAKIPIKTRDKDGNEREGSYTLKEGRPFVDVVPMSEVFIDNYHAENIDEVQELVQRRPFDLDYVKRKWNIDAKPDNSTKQVSHPSVDSGGKFSNNSDTAFVYVYEYYRVPTAEYPQGRFVVMVGDQVVYSGDLPYDNAKSGRIIPFDMISMQTLPGYTIGTTVYSQLIPMQDTFNSAKNRYLEYVNRIAIGQYYYWADSIMNEDALTTKPGKLVKLKRNSRPPQAITMEKLTNEFIPYLRTIEEDMLVTAGLSQLTAFGLSKSNMRTDGVVDKIDESDQNKLINALENISEATISVFKKILYLEQHRIKTLRGMLEDNKIRDEYQSNYSVQDVDPEQVSIVNRDFLMQSDQILEKKMAQLAQLGVFNPELPLPYMVKKQMLDAIQCNYLMETLDPEERATHDLVEEEHFLLKERKENPQAEHYHKHEQHLYEHNLFRISPEVRLLKDRDPEQYNVLMEGIQAHLNQHKKFMDAQADSVAEQDAKATFGQGTAE